MNKDKVYLKGYVIGRAADTLDYQGLMVQLENLDVVEIDKNLVHRDINESQKVTVPQFVADWIEKADKKISLRDLMSNSYMNFEVNGWFGELDKDGAFKNQETLSGWYFADDENGPVVGTHHTRDELENAGFGWVFDCPGIEIEVLE